MENKENSGIYMVSSIEETAVNVFFGGKIGIGMFHEVCCDTNDNMFGIKMVEFEEQQNVGDSSVNAPYDDKRCVQLFFHNDEEIENFIQILKKTQHDERRRKKNERQHCISSDAKSNE